MQVWERLDEEVASTPMPREYSNWKVRSMPLIVQIQDTT